MKNFLVLVIIFSVLAACRKPQPLPARPGYHLHHERQVGFLGKGLAPVDSSGFYWAYLGDSIQYRGVTGYQYLFIDRVVQDTILGWWGSYQDTLYYWSHHSYMQNCKQIVPFAALDFQTSQYKFCEEDCYEYRALTFGGNCVQVVCRSFSLRPDELLVEHLLYATGIDHENIYHRTYRISLLRGLIFYQSDFHPDSTTIDFPY